MTSSSTFRIPTAYSWGWPDDGRLGFGGTERDPAARVEIPHMVNPFPNFQFGLKEVDVVKAVAGGGRHSLFVTADGRVLASGWNGHGQCGDADKGTSRCLYRPQQVEGIRMSGKDIFCKNVSAGMHTSYALTGEGKVYSWGRGKYGGLGIVPEEGEDPEEDHHKARLVKELAGVTIAVVSAGYQHCMAKTFGGRVYAWGRNNYGQLGLGKVALDEGFVTKPTEIKFAKTEKIINVASGHNHSVALLEITRADNRVEIAVLAWGCPEDSRLGDCDPRMHYVPQEVHSMSALTRKRNMQFTDIKAGGAHTLLLEKFNGQVVGFGQGRFGQLGYGDIWDRKDPVIVNGVVHAYEIAAGARHSMALVGTKGRVSGAKGSLDGELFTWGFNDYGELGLGDSRVRLQPHKVSGMTNADVVAIAAGHKHSLCVTAGLAKKVRDLPAYAEYFEILHQEGMLVYDLLKKAMEEKGLNPDYLDTPDANLPGQPGLAEVPCEFQGSEPGMQYCIDTIDEPDENPAIMKLRGPYETTYHCVRCKFGHVCMACARHCHGQHPVKVNFKLRKYGDLCQCCKTDICNIRWSRLRHEFDKFALKNLDKCISVDEVQDVLEACRDEIEKKRGGMPLTSKQKEDDLKAALDRLYENAGKVRSDDQEEDENKDKSSKEESEDATQPERRKSVAIAKAAGGGERRGSAVGLDEKGRRKSVVAVPEKKEEEGSPDFRVQFKPFEKWYLAYFSEQDDV